MSPLQLTAFTDTFQGTESIVPAVIQIFLSFAVPDTELHLPTVRFSCDVSEDCRCQGHYNLQSRGSLQYWELSISTKCLV